MRWDVAESSEGERRRDVELLATTVQVQMARMARMARMGWMGWGEKREEPANKVGAYLIPIHASGPSLQPPTYAPLTQQLGTLVLPVLLFSSSRCARDASTFLYCALAGVRDGCARWWR